MDTEMCMENLLILRCFFSNHGEMLLPTRSCVLLNQLSYAFMSTIFPPKSNACTSLKLPLEVAGAFTQRLAARLRGGHLELQISLQGPFGRPLGITALPPLYVCGGVGITPCLARSRSQGRPRLYWALRSEALLRKVMESLELDELSCVKLKGRQAEANDTG